jgi:N6-adenosine-specific RNA methylase IME4
MTDWPFGDLKPLSYDLIMCDPPWRFRLWSKKGEAKSPEAQYRTMSIAEIRALPVGQLAAPVCLLWLWSTWPTLLDPGDRGRRIPSNPEFSPPGSVMKAWGFRYVTGGAWHKRTKTGKTAFGPGYVFRSACEPFLIGALGKPVTTKKERGLIEGLARGHSVKPEEAYALCERWLPQAYRRLELFSRTDRPGWTSWGDEAGKFNATREAAMGP